MSAAPPLRRRTGRCRAPGRRGARGVSYVEVLVAVALIAVALVPALNAVTAALPGSRVHLQLAGGMAPVHGKMEELLARPYPVLLRAAASGGSPGGSTTVAIAVYNPAVALAYPLPANVPPGPGYSDADFDVFIAAIDPTTGATAAADTGLLQLRVQAKAAGGGTLTAHKSRTEAWE